MQWTKVMQHPQMAPSRHVQIPAQQTALHRDFLQFAQVLVIAAPPHKQQEATLAPPLKLSTVVEPKSVVIRALHQGQYVMVSALKFSTQMQR